MNEVIIIEFGNYNVVFSEIGGRLYRPIISGCNEQRMVPLLLENDQIERVRKHLNKLPTTKLPFDLFKQVVSGACLYAIKRSMAE